MRSLIGTEASEMRTEAPKMTKKQIESWLNDSLEFGLQQQHEDKERMVRRLNKGIEITERDMREITGKNKSQAPMITLEIDRIALDKVGMD